MTSLPTPAKRRLTYQVSVRKRDKWSVAGTGDGLDKAMADARGALGTGKFQRVKVEQSFTDPSSNRTVATVIFEEASPAAPASTGISVWMLLTISVLLGIAMFFATRYLIHAYSG
jgi:hypothetical protein